MPVNTPNIAAPLQGQSGPLHVLVSANTPYAEFLPPIPLLTGIKNIKEWKYVVRVYLNVHDLLDFIDGTHAMGQAANADGIIEPVDLWRKRRTHAFTIINGTIDHKIIMPMLLTTGLRAHDDDYDFDPQTLWDYVCRYVRLGSREEDSLKDRILLHMFNPDYLDEESRFLQDEYLYLRRYLRDYLGVEVHPEIMKRLGVEEKAIEEDDVRFLGNLPGAQAVGKWPVEGTMRWSVSKLFGAEDFHRLEDGEVRVEEVVNVQQGA